MIVIEIDRYMGIFIGLADISSYDSLGNFIYLSVILYNFCIFIR